VVGAPGRSVVVGIDVDDLAGCGVEEDRGDVVAPAQWPASSNVACGHGQWVKSLRWQVREESRRLVALAHLMGLAETGNQAKYGREAADDQAHERRCRVASLAVEECEAEDRGGDHDHDEYSQQAGNDHSSR
jgi:hypothetical protein